MHKELFTPTGLAKSWANALGQTDRHTQSLCLGLSVCVCLSLSLRICMSNLFCSIALKISFVVQDLRAESDALNGLNTKLLATIKGQMFLVFIKGAMFIV